MQTTKRVVLPAYLSAVMRVSSLLKSFLFLSILMIGCPGLSEAQITFSDKMLPTGMDFSGNGSGSVLVADFDGDGFPDIVYNTGIAAGITYLKNNNGLSFTTPTPNPFASFVASTPTGVALSNGNATDFDGDGDVDIWVRVAGADNDFYLRNDGTVFTSVALPTGLEFAGAGVGNLKVADINGDGLPDVIYNTAPGGGVTYLQNNGGSFSAAAQNPFAAFTTSTPTGTLFTASCDIADFDGDGDLDIWHRQAAANDVYLQNNAGTYAIGSLPTGMEFTGNGAGGVKVADFNGDGLVDILYLSLTGSPITYWQNNLGSFSSPNPNPFSAYAASTPAGTSSAAAMSIADFNRDGNLDIWARIVPGADFYIANNTPPPSLNSSTPVHNTLNVVRSTNISLVFSKPVYTGTGSFQIRRVSDNSILETIAANGARVTGSGTSTIVIDPQVTLAANTGYYLTFTRTALADALGMIPGSLLENARTPASSPDFLSFTTSAVLPVTFGNLAAVLRNGELLVDWSTLTESSNDHFEIEASPDGQSFTVIGKTSSKAVGGNSSTTISYNFTRAVPGGLLAAGIFLAALAGFKLRSKRKNFVSVTMIALAAIVIFSACNKQSKDLVNSDNKIYIRVAQVDKDGTKSYSKVVTAQSE